MPWPPTEEQIRDIALAALNKSQDKDVTVLVYWKTDPNLMIFDPIHFTDTEYIHKKFEAHERSITLHIGKED
jgi:hypothetical protein